MAVPSLTRELARSFPRIPVCEGTHTSRTVVQMRARSLREAAVSYTVLEEERRATIGEELMTSADGGK